MVRNKTDTNSELFKEGYDVAMYKIPVEADSAIESAFSLIVWTMQPTTIIHLFLLVSLMGS